MKSNEIVIIGAGPAGITAAIFLAKQGIRTTLIDKEHFPRNKTCGDCLGGFAISMIRQIGDDFFNFFVKTGYKLEGKGVHFYGPDHQEISINATSLAGGLIHEVALSKRIDFDNFLLKEALKYKEIDFYPGVNIRDIKVTDQNITLMDDHKDVVIKAEMAILATGSQLYLKTKLDHKKMDKKHLAAGIRGYFEHVTDSREPGYIELHFLKDLAPGYFWIFPLPGNTVNVGLGLKSNVIAGKEINLKTAFYEILENESSLKNRFKQARQIGELQGYPLALGGYRKNKISGNRYLLTGDTAHLIEPLFGEGIGHAMYSGKFAAEHAVKCLQKGDFTEKFNRKFDRKIYDKLGSTLKFSSLLHQLAFYPGLMNHFFNRIQKNHSLQEMISDLINGQLPKTPLNGLLLFAKLVFGT